MKNIRFFLGFIIDVYKKNRLYFFLKFFLSILQGCFPVITALIPQFLLDAILIDNNLIYFLSYVILFVCLQFTIPFIYSLLDIALERLFSKLNVGITSEMLDRLYHMRYETFDKPENYNVIIRSFDFSTGAGVNTFNTFLDIMALAITLMSFAYIVGRFNWWILLIIGISVLINYFIGIKKTKENTLFKNNQTVRQRRVGYCKTIFLDKYQVRDMHFSKTFDYVKKSFEMNSHLYQKDLTNKNLKIMWLTQIGALLQMLVIAIIMLSFGNMLYKGSL